MKKITLKVPFIVIVALLLIVGTVCSQSQIESNLELTIRGTSNIRDWKATSNTGIVKLMVTFNDGEISQISDAQVVIPVASIESDKGNIMNGKMYKALNKDTFPTVNYTLYRVEKNDIKNGQGELYTLGYLEIAGKKQLVDLVVHIEKVDAETSQIKLTKKLKMTDFDIELPTALFGLLKTDDEVTAHLKFKIKLKES